MHRAFRFKDLLLTVLICTMMFILIGCRSEHTESIRLGEWIVCLNKKAGLSGYERNTPYYFNIPEESVYFDDVQTAVEWGILDSSTPFDPDDLLTREWAAFTLIRLSGIEHADTKIIRDIRNTLFPDEVKASVSTGLMELDKHQCFNPKEVLDKQDAASYLDQVVEYINSLNFEIPVNNIIWKENLEFSDDTPEQIDENKEQAYFSSDSSIKKGDVFRESNDADSEYYQVDEIKEYDEYKEADIRPFNIEDSIDSAELQDSFEIDFSQAEIFDETDQILLQSIETSYTAPTITTVAMRPLTKSHTVNGYVINYSITKTGISASVNKEFTNGIKWYANYSLHNVKPTYKWEMKGGEIKHAYFKLDCVSTEHIGVKTGSYKELYGDLSGIKPDNFLSSILGMWKTKQEMPEVTIPIATIRIPVPSNPLLTIMMRVQLKIYTSGRAEIELVQNASVGMEIKNNHLRVISDLNPEATAVIRGNTSLMSGLMTALELGGMKLADFTLEGGAKTEVSSTVHLYDESNNHTTQSTTEVSADVIEELSQDNDQVLMCGDIKAYWVADMELNSSNTLAARIGLNKKITLLNEHNGKLIPGMKTHVENWQFVDRCTRGNRLKNSEQKVIHSNILKIKQYSMLLSVDEKKDINIVSIPSGYNENQLIYWSDDTSVATVEKGTVQGISEGSTNIHISTADQKYKAQCTVVIRHVDDI